MEYLIGLFNFVLHFDEHLSDIIARYQTWTYAILFLIIFAETGLVVTPILPGDSLLFVAGAFAAAGELSPVGLLIVLTIAAILGDTVNYFIGSFIGPKVFTQKENRFFKKEYLMRTEAFYEKHGPKTIVLARFVPIVRTFAPFVAGVGKMNYARFVSYNILGGILWVSVCVLSGYFFGNIPVVKENFEVVVLGIVVVSCIPAVMHFLPASQKKKAVSIVAFIAILLFAGQQAFAERIILKSGEAVEGHILHRFDDSLEIQLENGMTLTFYLDEIASVEEMPSKESAGIPTQEVNSEEPQTDDSLGQTQLQEEVLGESQEKPSLSTVVNPSQPILVPTVMLGPSGAKSVLDSTLKQIDKMEETQLNRPQELMRQMEEYQ